MKATMKRREISYSIPIDLTIEILSRLPAKSVGRFRCVSKQWTSMLYRPYYTELFLTSSWTRPRIFFALDKDDDWSFYSSPQPQNPCDKSSSLVVAADFHMKFPRDMQPDFFCLTYGLLYFSSVWISKENKYTGPMICNPNTGRYAISPIQPNKRLFPYHFFGFDPVDKQFKVLSLGTRYSRYYHIIMILTLGTGELIWREIESPIIHKHCWSTKGLCINGVLYYLGREIADDSYAETSLLLVCFHVKSEKFNFIDAQCFDGLLRTTTLINYKGKLGVIGWKNGVKLHMWVLEDVEKHDWSKHVYTLPENIIVETIFVVGMTARGELVLAMKYTSKRKSFYVFYFNPERKTLQTVEIQGLDENRSKVYAFVDHVEDLNVIDAKMLKLSQELNIIRKKSEAQRHTSVKNKRKRGSSCRISTNH